MDIPSNSKQKKKDKIHKKEVEKDHQWLFTKLLHVHAADLDDDNSGEVDLEEFCHHFVHKVGVEKALAKRLFHDIDVSGDGDISAKEFEKWKKKHKKPEQLMFLFEEGTKSNQHKKGKMERVKTKRSLSRASKPPKNAKSGPQRLFTKLLHVRADDLDVDDSGDVDRDEFVRYFRDLVDVEEKIALRLFEDIDGNGDGSITSKEFERYKKKHSKPASLRHLFH